MNKELQNNEKFIRCAGFIAEMIKKYGSEILDEQKDEENENSPLSFLLKAFIYSQIRGRIKATVV